MKLINKLLIILILIFNFQTLTKADDISEFEIEGISIGDTLLKKYSKKEINDFYKATYYSDNTYTTIESLKLNDNSQYDYISYSYKTNDKNYKIVSIVADVDSKESFNNDINKCYPLKDQIIEELKTLFNNSSQRDNGTFSHPVDKTGQSKITSYNFLPNNGGSISVSCFDYTDKIGYADSLRVGITTSEFNVWLNSKAYK